MSKLLIKKGTLFLFMCVMLFSTILIANATTKDRDVEYGDEEEIKSEAIQEESLLFNEGAYTKALSEEKLSKAKEFMFEQAKNKKLEEQKRLEEERLKKEKLEKERQENKRKEEESKKDKHKKSQQVSKQQTSLNSMNLSSESGWITVTATHYTAYCNGCTGITATGINVKNSIYHNGYRVIAVDPKIIKLGSIVEVKTPYETFKAIAGDTGGAIKNKKIDILVESKEKAYRLGRYEAKIRILK